MKKMYLYFACAAAIAAITTATVIVTVNRRDETDIPETTAEIPAVVTVEDIPKIDSPIDTIAEEPTEEPPIEPEITIPVIVPVEAEPEPDMTDDVVIYPEETTAVTVNISEPETRSEPPAPPVVKESEILKNPDVVPAYEEKQTVVSHDSNKPKNGEKKDGMIFIEGFGWIVDEGGGSVGYKMGDDGDTLTGNKVGDMG